MKEVKKKIKKRVRKHKFMWLLTLKVYKSHILDRMIQ